MGLDSIVGRWPKKIQPNRKSLYNNGLRCLKKGTFGRTRDFAGGRFDSCRSHRIRALKSEFVCAQLSHEPHFIGARCCVIRRNVAGPLLRADRDGKSRKNCRQ